jgi:hypothetical protein
MIAMVVGPAYAGRFGVTGWSRQGEKKGRDGIPRLQFFSNDRALNVSLGA